MSEVIPGQDQNLLIKDAIQPPATTIDLSFHADAMDYFILVLKTTLLTALSFGLYYPWARCRRLHFTYRHTRAGQHNLAFSGTGKEIAIGYLKGLLIYGLVYGIFLYTNSKAETAPMLAMTGSIFFTLAFYGLFLFAVWGARAYRCSRLSYRGIRFSMEADQRKSFVKKTMLDCLLLPMTLGFYYPIFTFNFSKRLIDGTSWGGQMFRFVASRSESYKLSVTNFLLSVFSLGLLMPVAWIRRINFNLRNIEFGEGMRLRSDLSLTDGYALILFPLLVSTLSLGLLHPWAKVWSMRKFYAKISFEGHLDLNRIKQLANKGGALGESAGDLLNLDMGLGV